MSFFDEEKEVFKIDKPIRLIELFAGVGSQAMALRDLGADFEHYRVVEFDKYAIKSYNAIHGTAFPTMDIIKIQGSDLGIKDVEKFTYLMTYSFPCQDLSVAGKQKGMKKGSGTRSGLLWEVERLLDECIELNGNLPQVLLMENVLGVIGAKNIDHFKQWQRKLETLGYSNYCEMLNAKDYGVPQNRKRCFMISVLGDYYYEFPKPFNLELRLKDILEDEVDEKYFLNDLDSEYAYTITTNAGNRATDNFIIDAQKTDKTICLNPKGGRGGVEGLQPSLQDRIYDSEGIAPACTTSYMPNVAINHIGGVAIPEATKKGWSIAKDGDGVYINRPHQKRGVVQNGMIQTLKTSCSDVGVATNNLRIRKLTPLECFRLMGFDDEDFYKAEKVNSNTQLYKQAGNSIVKNVLVAIFGQMIGGKERIYAEI